jgi:transposase InsO family protein
MMSQQRSPGTDRRYPLTLVCRVWQVGRSSVYAAPAAAGAAGATATGKRGPHTALSDADLVARIREVLAQAPFHGEGYRKVWARLRHGADPMLVGRQRVLRLMRRHQLLTPTRSGHPHGPKAHDGRIVTDAPDVMWGTDGTRFFTEQDGWCWLFTAVDHHTSEIVGHYVTKRGDRFAALEPVAQGVRTCVGAVAADAARGLAVRHDHGPQYAARDFRAGLTFLGITPSPAFVGEPQGNGVAERAFPTVEEQCLHLHRFQTLEEARQVIAEFVDRYNEQWLVAKLGYRPPAAARRDREDRAA